MAISISKNMSGSARLMSRRDQSKYMALSYFMKKTSFRCFWLLDYVEASVDLLNGLCFVQIQQSVMKILPKNIPAQGKFLISSIFDL